MQVPNHLAIILDGNRRWARAQGLPVWKGHEKGAEIFDKFLDWCLELNVPMVSAWVLSSENLNRSKEELNAIFNIFKKELQKWVNDGERLEKYEVQVRFFGDFHRLPKTLVKLMQKLMQKTSKYRKKFINILIAYGGKFELTHAIKRILMTALKSRIRITQKTIEKNLLLPEPIDLVIRPGGYNRLSNFALWQTAYSEIYITKTLWPDFSKTELIKAIKWYNSLPRNFGR